MIDHELLACEQRAQHALDRMRACVQPDSIEKHYEDAKREITQAIRLAFERQDKALEHRFITFLVHIHAQHRFR